MAYTAWKGSVRFGLVSFPVAARLGVKSTTFAFNLHHDPAECAAGGARLASGKSVCTGCGEEVEKDQIVKGYNGVPGIDTAYLESLEKEKSGELAIDKLVPADEIDARLFASSYDLVAESIGAKPYALLMRVLVDQGQVAVGKVVMRGKEYIVVLRPRDGALAMEVLHWPEDVTENGVEARDSIAGVEITDQELAMGRMLADSLSGRFDPSEYHNEWAEQMREFLARHVAGQEQPAIEHKTSAAPVMDLAAALEASLAAAKPAPKARKKAA